MSSDHDTCQECGQPARVDGSRRPPLHSALGGGRSETNQEKILSLARCARWCNYYKGAMICLFSAGFL